MNNKIRWGIIGCAGIAIRQVIPAIQQSNNGEVVAIASRGEAKAKETAEKLDIPKAYGSYEALLADESIDAVYIPLPNHLHKEWTIHAAEAGKHILCEKPLALTAAEAQEMIDACDQANVLLAEAFMYRHHPRYEKIHEIIKSGEIGEIRAIHGKFTFNNADDLENVRVQKHMGGGSLYDVGCYPISAARLILLGEPEAATVHALFSSQHDDVDMMASGLVEFNNKVALVFDCGMWAEFRNNIEILGSKGRIEIPTAFLGKADFTVFSDSKSRMETFPQLNSYTLEVEQFGRAIMKQEDLRFSPQDAVLNMKVIDACLKSARERTRITIK